MRDKFRVNLGIVLPAALIALVVYLLRGIDLPEPKFVEPGSFWLMLPYLLVLISALAGVNVLVVLRHPLQRAHRRADRGHRSLGLGRRAR